MHVSEYTQRKIYVSNVGVELDPQKGSAVLFKVWGNRGGSFWVLIRLQVNLRDSVSLFTRVSRVQRRLWRNRIRILKVTSCTVRRAIDGPKPTKLGVPLAHGVVQYAGLQQSASVYGPRVTQVGRSDGAVLIGGLNSSVGGPGHLIAPPASLAGLGVSNGGHAIKSAIGNQVGGTGGYVKPGLISGYGASAQMIGSYGGAVMGQASLGNNGILAWHAFNYAS
ncbi:hypothetical protein HPP92_013851 [Vanilla planifolia]|uniref:Uncharacterized protein n=1 Tax=Vanilla planifolia TaxID=51239 RepID=A0A835R2S1_VANPL|nr:hypothetical protein HPP92_013851 [Vanilla planifolia]